jgi:hypothetical protein
MLHIAPPMQQHAMCKSREQINAERPGREQFMSQIAEPVGYAKYIDLINVS